MQHCESGYPLIEKYIVNKVKYVTNKYIFAKYLALNKKHLKPIFKIGKKRQQKKIIKGYDQVVHREFKTGNKYVTRVIIITSFVISKFPEKLIKLRQNKGYSEQNCSEEICKGASQKCVLLTVTQAAITSLDERLSLKLPQGKFLRRELLVWSGSPSE